MKNKKTKCEISAPALRRSLLRWYDRHARTMPWRTRSGEKPDPYHVWLSEIMLQQTTVATVGPYFLWFIEKWPTVEVLADAALDDVLHGWQGLGYYARARNLHRCAQTLRDDYGGAFPEDEAALLKLPGIGGYTAAAIRAIAFGRPANVVDGNVERVMARIFAIPDPLPGIKPRLNEAAAELAPTTQRGRPGDYAQALMDLGATICTPRKPACALCPLSEVCKAARAGIAEELPRREPKADKPLRRGTAFWIEGPGGTVLLRRRPEKGLLGGMMEFPSTPWKEHPVSATPDNAGLPISGVSYDLPGTVRHVFTHFRLELSVARLRVTARFEGDGLVWCPPDRLGDYALPTVMKKIARHALKHA